MQWRRPILKWHSFCRWMSMAKLLSLSHDHFLVVSLHPVAYRVCVTNGERWSRGRSHLKPFQNLGNFVHLTLPVSFRRDTKSRWSLLSGVYARESKRSHTGGKCVTCSGLTILENSCVSPSLGCLEATIWDMRHVNCKHTVHDKNVYIGPYIAVPSD